MPDDDDRAPTGPPDEDRPAPSGLPDEDIEETPLGVAEDAPVEDDPDHGAEAMPGIPTEGEPPTAG